MPYTKFLLQLISTIFLTLVSLSNFADPDSAYKKAIENAANHKYNSSNKALLTLENYQEKLVTFTNFNRYRKTDTVLGATIWTAVDSEFKPLCKQYVSKTHPSHKQLTLWIGQMLGLSPSQVEMRRFIVFVVPNIQAYYGRPPNQIGIFRPCTDPRIGPHADGSPVCPKQINAGDSNIAPEFKSWFINESINAYTLKQDPDKHQFIGYPWTEYGFTYNWNPKAKNPYGVSEFVVLKNTPITVLGNPLDPSTAYVSPEQYCTN